MINLPSLLWAIRKRFCMSLYNRMAFKREGIKKGQELQAPTHFLSIYLYFTGVIMENNYQVISATIGNFVNASRIKQKLRETAKSKVDDQLLVYFLVGFIEEHPTAQIDDAWIDELIDSYNEWLLSDLTMNRAFKIDWQFSRFLDMVFRLSGGSE